jgi:DNA-binding winged helix-turn-helix (wHTH) protein/TolB-like protein/Tfp pilus assembly protein PilF
LLRFFLRIAYRTVRETEMDSERQIYKFESYSLDARGGVLLRDGLIVHVTPKALDVLLLLVRNPGMVVEKDRLLKEVWAEAFVEEGSLPRTIHELRRALGDDSSRPTFIETITKRGYRFVAPVRCLSFDQARDGLVIERYVSAQVTTREEEVDTPGLLSPARFSRYRKLLAFGSLAALVSIAIVVGLLLRSSHSHSNFEIKTVAVLPLRSLDVDEPDKGLGLKLTDALIQRLGRLRQIVVRSTRAVQIYEGKPLDPLEAGREQQVDAVLDGSFQHDGQRLRVRVELLRVSDGQQVWASTFDERSSDPFFLQDALAEQTAQTIVPELAGVERKLVARHDTENIEANRLYTEARYDWNKRNVEGIRKSVELLEQALALDPKYARAYAALADSYITLSDYALLSAGEAFPKARDAGQKALAIDDSLAEAYTALAMVKADYDWDWAGADRAFQQAIERNSHYATTHQWYAEFLTGMGRHQEAMEQIHQAQQLDPLSSIIESIEALNLNYARDYDGSIAQCKRVISRDPSFGEVYAYLGFSYEQKGMFREAMDAYQTYSTLMGYNTPAAAAIRSSPVSDARDYWEKMIELSKLPSGSQFGAAQALAQLGETDKALSRLEQACANRSYGILYLKVHPNLDPLRSTPRFKDLLRRLALAE